MNALPPSRAYAPFSEGNAGLWPVPALLCHCYVYLKRETQACAVPGLAAKDLLCVCGSWVKGCLYLLVFS